MAGQDTDQDKAKFVIVVGSTSRPLGLILRDKAFEYALAEASRIGSQGSVILLEQTDDQGAVNVSFGK